MKQQHLDRLVARATGETVAVVRRIGFGLDPRPPRPGAGRRRRPRKGRRRGPTA